MTRLLILAALLAAMCSTVEAGRRDSSCCGPTKVQQ